MENLFKKFLFAISAFVLTMVFGRVIIQYGNDITTMFSKSNIIEKDLRNENISPAKLEEQSVTETVYRIYVPFYWKDGFDVEKKDYLAGSLPNMKNFKKYWSDYNHLVYGHDFTKFDYTINDVIGHAKVSDITLADGILNQTNYFDWNTEECTSFFSEGSNKRVFICPKWINWLGCSLDDKDFIAVECSVGNLEGYCLFEDYIKTYYKIKNIGENRCFDYNEKYFCSYNRYKENIFK